MQSSTTNAGFFIEDELWKQEIKENLFPALMETFPHTRWLTGEFPTGDTITIPTTGRMPVRTYVEGDELTLEDPTLNEIQLTIDKYYQAGIRLTDKFKQDSYLAEMGVATWRQDMIRGLKEKIEADIFNTIHTDSVNGQTPGDDNDIDDIDHRWAASGTSQIFDFADFAHAKYVFDKGNVQKDSRVMVVDPKVSHDLLLNTATNAGDVYRQDVYGMNQFIKMGFGLGQYTGMFYGFHTYETNLLPTMDSETLPLYGTVTTAALTSPVVNQAFGFQALFGAFRQEIEVEQFRDGMRKQDVISACVRYGNRVYRAESIVAILSV